jgi:hypothetical protein
MKTNYIFITAILFLALDSCQNINDDKVQQRTTKIEIEEKSFYFGTIKQSDSADHVFKIKNVGDVALLIKSAKASCGCTVPEWSKIPIKPNNFGEIRIKFKPTETMDGIISKSVVFQANTDSIFHVLYLKGIVIKN